MLVIGGGITGAGVALDAASRGLRTALVEKGDFASGTSSKSSKMVHGGLRYLQQREFRLVYENLAERQRLLDNAPHLVTPAPLPHPALRPRRRGHQDRGPLLRHRPLALRPHRRLAHRRAPPGGRPGRGPGPPPHPRHRPPGGRLPLLRRPGRRRPADPDRRCARRRSTTVPWSPTTPRSSASPTGERRRASTAPSCGRTEGDESSDFAIRAPVVVNATGVWADEVRALDEGADPHSIRPAKGIHVTVPADRLPVRHRRGHPGPQGPAVDLRRLLAGDRPRLPGHHRHRLRRARSTTRPARPRTSTTSWTRPTPSPPRTSPGPTSPACGPACARCWRPDEGRARLGAHGRPVAAPHRQRVGRTASSPSPAASSPPTGRWPQDTVDVVVGRLGESPRPAALRHQDAPAQRRHRPDPRPGGPGASPHGRDCSAATAPRPAAVLAAGRRSARAARAGGRRACPTPAPRWSTPSARRWPCTLDDVLVRRTRATIQRAQAAMARRRRRGRAHRARPGLGRRREAAGPGGPVRRGRARRSS